MTPAEIKEIDCRIQRAGAANCWTGTLGSLAADARRLVKHIHKGRAMADIPVDHILQGEAELKARRYTGDEAEFIEEVPRPAPTLRPLPPVKELAAYVADEEKDFPPLVSPVDEVESRKAAAFTADGFYRDSIDELWSKVACLPEGWKITTRAAIHPTSRKYIDLLDKLRDLHLSKSADYGTSDDPLANIRNGAAFVGIEPWRACLVRLSDKVTRIGTYCAKGTLSHEGVEDSFLDLAAYSLLTLLLHQEQTAAPPLPAAGAGDD